MSSNQKMAVFILSILVLTIVGARFPMSDASRQTAAAQYATEQEQRKACEGTDKLFKDRLIVARHEGDWTKIWVAKGWDSIDVLMKEQTVTLIARCLSNSGAVEAYDNYSGKEVASFTPFGRFKTY